MEIYYSINNPFIISYKFIGLNWISCPFFDNSYIELIAHCPLPYSLTFITLRFELLTRNKFFLYKVLCVEVSLWQFCKKNNTFWYELF